MGFYTPYWKIVLALLSSLALSSSAVAAAPTNAEITTRLLAQEGLAIAFASTVLHTQVDILAVVVLPQALACISGPGYSEKIVSRTETNGVVSVVMKYYFDTKCTDLFATAAMTSTFQPRVMHLKGEVQYRNRQSVLVGTLAINEHAYGAGGTLPNFTPNSVAGLGTFTPVNGRPSVSLGLTCDDFDMSDSQPIPCAGGVAQSFPKLGLSLGSVSPLQLNAENTVLTFMGANSLMALAPLGTLSIGLATPLALGLVGNYQQFSTTATNGKAGTFGLFPPMPTHWTINDTAHHQKFTISVVSDVNLNSVGTVVNTNTNAVLATINVDQSGTGAITYADGSAPPITSWTLGD